MTNATTTTVSTIGQNRRRRLGVAASVPDAAGVGGVGGGGVSDTADAAPSDVVPSAAAAGDAPEISSAGRGEGSGGTSIRRACLRSYSAWLYSGHASYRSRSRRCRALGTSLPRAA